MIGRYRVKEPCQFRSRSKLWNRIQFLECRCERIREAPYSSGLELLVLRIEVKLVYPPRQVPWNVQVTFNERSVDRQLYYLCRQLLFSPNLNLLTHRFKVPLHSIYTNGKCIFKGQVLRVLRQNGAKAFSRLV